MVTRLALSAACERNCCGVRSAGKVEQGWFDAVQVNVLVTSAPLMPWIGEASRMSGMYSKNLPLPPRTIERPVPKRSYAKPRRGAMLFVSFLICEMYSGCCGYALPGGTGVFS